MRFVARAIVFVVLVFVSLPIRVAGEEQDFGPLFDDFSLTLSSGHRSELLGPFFSTQQEDTLTTSAFSPLLSIRQDPVTDFSEFQLLYPLLTYHRFGGDYRYQIAQLFSFSGGPTMDETNRHRISIFPFYFQQRSPDPALNYTAIVPFYGHLQNRFFRDEIFFVMFPIYMQTRKKDVITDNFLAPFFDRKRGDGMKGWQFWPLVGHDHKIPTTSTNLYGEEELVGGYDKRFVLWPIFFHNDLGIGTTNLQTQRLLLPFYSIQRSPLRDTSSFLWPLGYTHTEDREKKYREWAMPWPLIDFARGEGKTLNRVWPFYSHGKTPTFESEFYLWPIYKHNHVMAEPLDRERTRILFFLYSDLVERNTGTGTAVERKDLWPIFTWHRDHNGNRRLQVLAPVEPILPNNPGVERNYSPLWSLWRSEKNPKTGASSQSCLWNLYRREVRPDRKKFSLLFGLIHYQSGPEGKRWRLFYIPLGKPNKPAADTGAGA